MLKKFKEIRKFNTFAQSLNKSPENSQTKIGYATKKVAESFQKILRDFQVENNDLYFKEVESVQIDNAITDPHTKALLVNEKVADRPYLYTAEGKKNVMLAERKFDEITGPHLLEAWDSKEFEVTPFYVREFPVTLSDEQIETFTGFIIDPENPPTFPTEENVVVETTQELEA